MAKKKRKKKSNRQKIKSKAWKEFSRYIRLRDSDDNGIATCVTCNKKAHWSDMDAGHGISGRNNSVLFHEDLCAAQCKACNIFKKGNYEVYALKLIEKHGLVEYRRFLSLKNAVLKLSEYDLQVIYQLYKEKALEQESKLH